MLRKHFGLVFLTISFGCAAKAAESAPPTSSLHCEAFRAWQEINRPTAYALSSAQCAEGVALAKARRDELKTLMQRDPRSALKWVVTIAERIGLPKEIADELETEISGTGYVGAFVADPVTETNAVPSVSMTVNGQVVRVFLHGSQLARKQWYGEPVKGIVLDAMAVMEDPAGAYVTAAPLPRLAAKVVTRSYDPGSIRLTRQGAFDRVELVGVAYLMTGEPGMPGLPSDVFNVALPPGAEVKGIRVQCAEQELREGVIPLPVQVPLMIGQAATTNVVAPDDVAYSSVESYPREVAALAGDHSRLGHRYVSILINPVRYVGATKVLSVVTDVTVTIEYTEPFIMPRVPAGTRVDEAKASIQGLVINPDEVESPSPPHVLSGEPAFLDAPAGTGRVDYLIITSDSLASAFTNLAAHRQAFSGFTTEIITVSNIVASYSGTDTQSRVRTCIRDYVQTRQTAMVVLGGDDITIPVRIWGISFSSYGTSADLYYSGLDGSGVDYAYDVVVGRIPVRTSSEMNAYTGKVIAYDEQPPYELARKVMISGTSLWGDFYKPTNITDSVVDGHLPFTSHTPISDAEIWVRRGYRDFIQTNGNRYTVSCLFDTLTSWDIQSAGDYAQTGNNLMTRLNQGWNMVYNYTHGSDNFIVCEQETSFGTWMQAMKLTNQAVVFLTGACLTGAFDDRNDPCLSEAMLRNPNGGSLVYLGTSRSGWGPDINFPEDHQYRYWGGISPLYCLEIINKCLVEQLPTYGKAFAEAKLALSSQCTNVWMRDVQYMFNFQGDPALGIIGAKPSVSVEAIDSLAVEGDAAPARFMIRRDPAAGELVVNLAYAGSAGEADFVQSRPASLTFTNGEGEKILILTATDDGIDETPETVTVSIVPDATYEPGVAASATITILDPTPLPAVMIAAPVPTICEWPSTLPAGDFTLSQTGRFVITRTANTTTAVTVYYAISGTARAADYTGMLSGEVVLAAGQSSTTLTVIAVNNGYPDGDRSLVMTLQPSADYVPDPMTPSATITILDEEPRPVVSVSVLDATLREHSDDTATFQLSRTGDTTLPLLVDFTFGGTCSRNRYLAPVSPVAIPAGYSNLSLTVFPLNDTEIQPAETIVLSVPSNESRYVVTSPGAATATMLDDDNLLPTVSLSASSTNYVTGDLLMLTATAADDWGIQKVDFYHGYKILIATVSNAPYQCAWTGRYGTVQLMAEATDIHGSKTSSEIIHVTGTEAVTGGGFALSWWTNLAGSGLAALTNDARYPANPDGSAIVSTGTVTFSLGTTNRYGERMRGFFIPPADGWYRFYCKSGELVLSSSDPYLLQMSSDDSPTNLAVIGGSSRPLQGGRKYYCEVLMVQSNASPFSLSTGQESPLPYYRFDPWHDLALVADTNAIAVPEGGTAQFNLSLNQAPTATVSVVVRRVFGDADIVVQSATNLTFDAGNWDVPQAVTLAALADPDTTAGVAEFTCSSTTANGLSITATEVETAGNNPPLAMADSYLMTENSPLSVAAPGVLANDTDAENNALAATLVDDVAHGSLIFHADGSFTYTPATDWSGTDSFSYKASDGLLDSAPATVSIVVQSRPKVTFAGSMKDADEVTVIFDRPMRTTPAYEVAHYTLDQGVSILSASLAYDQRTVTLVTTGLTPGERYTLTINGLAAQETGAFIWPDSQVEFFCAAGVLPDPYACVLWLDAGIGIVDPLGGVSRWADQSAGANHMTQTNTALMPSLQTNAVNGLPALRFDGDRLSTASLQLDIDSNTVFLVIRPDDVSGSAQEFAGHAPDGRLRFNNGKLSGWFGADRDQADTNAPSADIYQIVAYRLAGNVEISIDGQPFETALGVATNISESAFIIGAVNNHFNGAIAEVIVYGKALSDAEAQAVKAYLANKYNMTRAIRILYQPVVSVLNTVIDEGSTTNLSVVLTAPPTGSVQYVVSRLSGSTNLVVTSGATLTFTPSNWSNAQTIAVASPWDRDLVDDTAVFQLSCVGVDPVEITVQQRDLWCEQLLPYEEPFEAYARGTDLAGVYWEPHGDGIAEGVITNGTPPEPSSGYPLPGATHTNAMEFYGQLSMSFDGATASHLAEVFVDKLIQPVFGPLPVGGQLAALSNAQVAVCFDTNGCVNVYRGVRASPTPGVPDTVAWLALTNAPRLATGDWCRLTVVVAYRVEGPMAMFKVALDSNFVSAAEGYAEADVAGARGGPWFISPAWHAADLRLRKLNLAGSGRLDDLRVTAGGPLLAANHTPVAWMDEAGLEPGGAYPTWDALALGDPDGDGVPTWAEHIAGTSPNDVGSVLAVAQPAMMPGGEQVVLSWPSVAGRTYVIQRGTNLADQVFVDLWTDIPARPPVNVHTGTVPEVRGVEFYRINVRLDE